MSKAKNNTASVEAMQAQTKRDTLVALIAAQQAAVEAWGGELALPNIQQSKVLRAAARAFELAGGEDGAYTFTKTGEVATGMKPGLIKEQVEAMGFNINNNGQQCIYGMAATGVFLQAAPKGGYIVDPAICAVLGGAK